MAKEKIRLCKLMSLRGICSRREAEKYIEQNLIKVDGVIIKEQGTKVDIDCTIELLKKAKVAQDTKVTIILNKPLGYVSTQPEKGYKAAIELIKEENRFSPQGNNQKLHRSHLNKLAVIGRLDIDSTGLLLLSQDGTIAKKIIGNDSNVEKEYLVRVEGDILPWKIERLTYGMSLDGKKLKKAKVKKVKDNQLTFILTEGKKRQIRRMCEIVDLKVVSLKRIRIGLIRLNKLPIGKWRFLSKKERI